MSALPPETQALKDIIFSPCIPVEESLPRDIHIPWNLLIGGYILDLEDGIKERVPYFTEKTLEGYNKFSNDFFVSPDGKWLAYQDPSFSKLFVEPTETLLTNDDVDRIVWDKEYQFHVQRWVDNDTVLIIYPPREGGTFFPTVFLNPFTGEEYGFFLETMPNYLDYKYGGAAYVTHYLHSGELAPDPTMKKVVYPEKRNGETYNTLWDIKNEEPLARLRYLPGYVNDPLWAQDGDDVLLLSYIQHQKEPRFEEWFLVTSNGVVKQITRFGDILQDYEYYLSNASRSWDGRFLVFQLRYNFRQPDEIIKYILLDLKANTLEGYCIILNSENSSFGSPVWSPDSRYFIIDTDRNTKQDIVMVDVENKKAYQIARDWYIIGWIKKP